MTFVTPAGIGDIAASLLGRPLSARDGWSTRTLEQVEKRLGRELPTALRDFHRLVGRVERFTSGFEEFLPLDKLMLLDDKLLFLDENQGVCQWGVDDAGQVWQLLDSAPEWHKEEPGQRSIEDFIRVLLYYQLAQGGYRYASMFAPGANDAIPNEAVFLSSVDWPVVIDTDGLHIRQRDTALLWHLKDHGEPSDGVFISCLRRSQLDALLKAFPLDDLT
ncbi:MAG: hypothetical protein Q4G70_14210 [Pseudomonadota bacterium]|nr:hypothetical protein [Pseudomonadota bacterium]